LSSPPQQSEFGTSEVRVDRSALKRGFSRSALPPRSQGGFVAAVVAICATALISYRSLTWRTDTSRLVAHTFEVTQALEQLLSTFKDAETGQRGYLLTADLNYLAPYEAAVASIAKQGALLQSLVGDNPQQAERIAAIAKLGATKMAEIKRTLDLGQSGRPEEALAVVRSDHGRHAMEGLRAAIGEMSDAERAILAQRTREWETAATISAVATWGGSALLLLLVVGAAVLSARDFAAQKRQAWLRRGESQLATSLQGAETPDVVGARVASFLGEYLEARVAAVFFADTPGRLRRVGAFGLPEGAHATAGADEPGGLTREAFRANRLIETRHVPEDFFAVSAGLGRGRARHLVVAPLSSDGAANGVLELGVFDSVMPFDLELLRLVAEPVGIALRAAHDRVLLRETLEETQRQAEELQSQQEELSVQNEELEQQGGVMRLSQARLETQQAELEQINAHLAEQAHTLGRQRDDLARAQADVQRASAYKSEFVANMSHELRTPLNSSLILARLLADNRDGNLTSEQVKFAETIYSAGNDLLTLINDILDLSKIEAGKLELRSEDVPLQRLADELADVFRPIARERGIDFSTEIEPAAPAAIATDPTRLRQILKNLISNALKFTERGGVSLRVRRAGDRVAFDVKDTGIGIPSEQHEVIFEAFRQADGTTSRKYGGTGLGLSISRDLARRLGADVTLDSAPGRGSTFTILVPERLVLDEDAPAAAPPPPVMRAAPRPTAFEAPPRSPPPADDEAREGRRVILIVEDDERFADVLERLARELDFEPIMVTTGEEALALAESARPSGIVLDVGLPDRSGLSVLDELKHRSATRHIPVHMISVSDYTHTALEMGAAGYAIKPVERAELAAALKHLETKFTQTLHRILVVEDDAVAREATCRLLAASDVETLAVGTAAQALAELGAATFDCMVLDLSLPDRSGFELLEEMSRDDRAAFPPVIVYTGRSLSRAEEQRLRQLSRSIIVKGARSPERLLDEVTLFLHQVESELPPDRQRMLADARHREAVFEGRRVLVVEDDVRNIFALSSLLEPRGAKVEIARNGREALERVRIKPEVDLVLMDVMMPEMDGLEATRRIRALPEHAGLPIIALTAKAMSDDRDQCLHAGANDYIAKPLDVDKLLSLVRVWMPK
jgi:signal transduction histidine kinase/DNA-binding response OmpR family regulator/CHASE3 domain sensor protein